MAFVEIQVAGFWQVIVASGLAESTKVLYTTKTQ